MDLGVNPLTTNLVVADKSRTEKTICLAVTPALKSYGVSGRARLFEVVQAVKEINAVRLREYRKTVGDKNACFQGKSADAEELEKHPEYELEYLIAPPRMRRYMEVSNQIVSIYLRYIAPEDIHIYSIDEVFMDVTAYLKNYHMSAHELAMKMVRDVLTETDITATAGIGTNLFLAKVAMDVVAKKMPPDKDGVRVAELDEMSYREQLWNHEPITDIWRVGRGYRKRLSQYGMFTMGDVARCSIQNPDLLFKLFGINAELLIDHAWGYEPTQISHIRQYRPKSNSVGSGQVLQEPYTYEKGELIVREMTELLVLDLVKKGLVTDQMVLSVGYDIESLTDKNISKQYHGEIVKDHYGRRVPKPAHGSVNLDHYMSSTKKIVEAVIGLYEKIVDENLLVRRVTITANHVIYERDLEKLKKEVPPHQMTLLDGFMDGDLSEINQDDEQSGNIFEKQYAIEQTNNEKQEEILKEKKERSLQKAILSIQDRYGKNALLKGMNLEEGAMTIERNSQVGGHKG